MKKFIKIGISLLTIVALFVSCNVTTDDVILSRNAKTQVNLSSATLSVTEGSATPITIETQAPAANDIIFTLIQVGGNAVEGVDYNFAAKSAADYGAIGGRIVIPAYATSGSVDIMGIPDVITDNKTAIFELRSIQSLIGVVGGNNQVTVSVKNFLSDDLEMSFDWNQDVVIPGYGTFDTCSNIDFDIFVSDAAGFDISNPWATFNNTGSAATGDCPENLTMNMADWGDGEYVIWHDLWSQGFFGFGLTDLVPIRATFTRWGAFTTSLVQDPSQTINLSTEGEYVSGSGYTGAVHNGFIAKITIGDGKFTVTDYSGANIASGKIPANKRTPRPDYIKK